MPVDGIRGTQRYDHQDDERIVPAKKERVSPEALQAKFIASEHAPMEYPAELFAGLDKKPGIAQERQPDGGDTKPTGDVAKPLRAPGEATAGKLHTTSPNELPVTQTKLPTKEMVSLIRKHWPELTERGARTLAAQWAIETGFGKNCYSNNFGNVKATSDKVGHMYLSGIWEFPTPRTAAAAEKMVAASGGMAELADAKFKASKGYPADAPIVVFKPPHPQTRFTAFKTADEGMAAYVSFKQKIAAKHPEYSAALNRGDVQDVAAVLAKVRYATAPEAAYASGMARAAKTIDSELGPAS